MSDETFQKDLTNKLSKLCGIIPVGTPWMGFDLKSKPLGVQLYQGQLLDRNTYAVHYSWIQDHRTIVSDEEWNAYAESHNGMCPYFSYGNNTNTYRMPKIVNVHPKFTNSNNAGNYVEAGLPNITGTFTPWAWYASDNSTGAFYKVSETGSSFAVSGNTSGFTIGIDASRSSSIYGKSDTVQPPAINMLIGEYVFSTIGEITKSTEDIVISNIEKIEWLESIQEAYVKKSDVSSYVVETWISGTSGYRIYSDGWIEQWGMSSSAIASTTERVTLFIEMKDMNYRVSTTQQITTSTNYADTNCTGYKKISTIIIELANRCFSGTSDKSYISWYVSGYIKE